MSRFFGQRTCTPSIKEYIPDIHNDITHTTIATMLTEEDYLTETYAI